MTLPIFPFPEHLPDWYVEAEALAQEQPTLAELVAGAYGDALPPRDVLDAEHADWLSEKQEQAWLIGSDVLFGSSAWFDEQPEVPF